MAATTARARAPLGQWGWGNPLASHVDASKVNVVNRAVGGLSSRTYLTSGHWERTLALVKPGDVVLMQFGHNDGVAAERRQARARHDPRHRRRVGGDRQPVDGQARDGAQLRLVPAHVHRRHPRQRRHAGRRLARSRAKPGTSRPRTAQTRTAMPAGPKQVARSEKVGFIDLNDMVARHYDEIGRDEVMKLFPLMTPDERIHTNWPAPNSMRSIVAAGLKALGDQRIDAWLKPREDVRPVVDARSVRDEAPRDSGAADPVPGGRLDRQERRPEWRHRLGRTHRTLVRHAQDQRGQPRDRRAQQPHLLHRGALGQGAGADEARRLRDRSSSATTTAGASATRR